MLTDFRRKGPHDQPTKITETFYSYVHTPKNINNDYDN